MRIRCAGSGAWLLLALAAARPAAGCRVEAALEPASAYVGQQVLHHLTIESAADAARVEWIEPPRFPAMRAERLPDGDALLEGGTLRRREERRALFAEGSGVYTLPAARLRCGTPGAWREARLPPLALRVHPLPRDGRPEAYTGLVGPLELRRFVTPDAMALGESLRIAVRLEGGGNLWVARDPYPDDALFAGAELFRRNPETLLERGARLLVGRLFRYEVVPREALALRIPELRVVYFDPGRGAYAVASLPAVVIPVSPRPAGASRTPDAAAQP